MIIGNDKWSEIISSGNILREIDELMMDDSFDPNSTKVCGSDNILIHCLRYEYDEAVKDIFSYLVNDCSAKFSSAVLNNVLQHAVTLTPSFHLKELLKLTSLDVNCQLNEFNDTPLITALKHHKNVNALILLNDNRVDVNRCDNNGWNPLMLASINSNINGVTLLLEDGRINTKHCMDDGRNIGTFMRLDNKIFSILDKYPSVNLGEKDADGWNALNKIIYTSNRDMSFFEEVARHIVSRGSDVIALDNKGRSTLLYAIGSNNMEYVKCLLKNTKHQPKKLLEEVLLYPIDSDAKKETIALLEKSLLNDKMVGATKIGRCKI